MQGLHPQIYGAEAPPGNRANGKPTLAFSVACLAAILAVILLRVWPALRVPWWFNTDEVVSYYEVIRQLRLDPSQTFFDIPGTPYITLTSLLTFLWWIAARVAGLAGHTSPSDFAFVHIQAIFTLMRTITLVLYVAAAFLAFDLFRRACGAIGALVATLLFVTVPIYVQYSYFARTESMGLVLVFSAIWILTASRFRATPKAYAWAGLLSGIAMAARYHFALTALPVILGIYFLRDRAVAARESAAGRDRVFAWGAAAIAIILDRKSVV